MASYYGTENDDNILITSDAYDRVFGLGGNDTIEVSGVSSSLYTATTGMI